MVCNHSRHPGVKAWRPFEIPFALITPPVSLPKGAQRNPGAHMPAIMNRQREHREPSFFVPGGRSIVGGYVECTAVTSAGVSTRRLLDWPDRIGETVGGRKLRPRSAWRWGVGLLAGSLFAGFAAQAALHGPAFAYVLRTYEGLPASTVTTAAGTFDVYDRPDLGRLITVASLGNGFAGDAAHDEAARAWLAGRGCAVVGSSALLPGDREHGYRCGR